MHMQLRVYANCWSQKSAGQGYRLRIPLQAMREMGLADTFCDDPFQDADKRGSYLTCGDVQVHFLTAGKAIHHQSKRFSEMKPAMNSQMEMQYPPVIVFDMDDDIESVNPLNPKFCTLGTRDGDGRLLMPEDEFGIMFNAQVDTLGQPVGKEEPVYLWRRGAMTPNGIFDVAKNVQQHAQVRKMAATAHAITCSSEKLGEVASRWNNRVFVYPNSLLFSDYHRFDIRRHTDDVRVLWQGGYSHFPDFYPLKPAFTEVSHKLPQIKWVVFGTCFRWVYDSMPLGRVEDHPWVSYEMFHLKLGTLAFDINIAPLADTRFNRCKSGIKFYEAAALGVPTLAQRVGPYAEEIVDGENGLLFSQPQEFTEKLERLVKDADYRVALGKRAEEWVHEYRDAHKNVKPLVDFYHALRSEVWGLKRAA